MRKFLLAALAVCVSSALAHDNQPALFGELEGCSALVSNLARLDCFDRVMREYREVQPAVAVTPTPAAPKPALPRSVTPQPATPQPATPQPAAPQPAAPPQVPEASKIVVDVPGDAEAEFGSQQSKGAVRGVITDLRELSRGEYVITLDNGQVWREIEARKQTRYKIGQVVSVTKKLLAYRLRVEGTGVSANVRRLK